MADELEAEGLVFGAQLQAIGLGLPPLLPAHGCFGGNYVRFLKQGPPFFELPFKDIVKQSAIGAACGKCVVKRRVCAGIQVDHG